MGSPTTSRSSASTRSQRPAIGFTVILRALEFGDQYLIKHEFIKALYGRYRAEGIEIPVPGRTVIMRQQENAAVPRTRHERHGQQKPQEQNG